MVRGSLFVNDVSQFQSFGTVCSTKPSTKQGFHKSIKTDSNEYIQFASGRIRKEKKGKH